VDRRGNIVIVWEHREDLQIPTGRTADTSTQRGASEKQAHPSPHRGSVGHSGPASHAIQASASAPLLLPSAVVVLC
jgi:hypothetical protein